MIGGYAWFVDPFDLPSFIPEPPQSSAKTPNTLLELGHVSLANPGSNVQLAPGYPTSGI